MCPDTAGTDSVKVKKQTDGIGPPYEELWHYGKKINQGGNVETGERRFPDYTEFSDEFQK